MTARPGTAKRLAAGHYQALYGGVIVSRHLYQTSAGGATRCPMEEACGLSFGAATPLLAETLSFKVSALTPGEVAKDLAKHGLQLSTSFIRDIAQQVGRLAVEKATTWQLEAPSPETPVEVVATGFDGTTAPIRGEDYKEAMCGAIALYDKRGDRLSTEYLGAMPEAGKADFTNRFTSRVARVLARYPKALHVVLSDGALRELATYQRALSRSYLDSRFLARGAASFASRRRDLRTSAGRGKVSLV